MKIIFMGTPEFAVSSLEACIDEHEVVAVFTQPDRPSGRGHKIKMSDVKVCAMKHDITVYQPNTLKDEDMITLIRDLEPDVIVVVAYGQILKKNILDIPKYGCVNVHGSILPYYRGAAPIHWAIVNGEKKTGVTTMYMDEGVDTGDILEIAEVDITDDMTSGQLHDILMEEGAQLLKSTLKKIQTGDITPMKQDDERATYAPLLDKNVGIIDWNKRSLDIVNVIRGFNPWPCAAGYLSDKRIKFYQASVGAAGQFGQVGEIVSVSKEALAVQAADGLVLLEVLGFPNQKKMHISQYLLGNNIDCGLVFSQEG